MSASSWFATAKRWMCALKVKPPMCIDIASADFFVDSLDRVLRTGW